MDSGFTGLRLIAAALVLASLALLSSCGAGSSSPPDWFYHWNCNGDSECLATNPTGAPSGTSDEGPNESSCTELLQFAQNFWNMPPATDSCDQNANGSSGGGSAGVTISGFSPASTAPGNNVTIDGSGFTSSTTVTVDGVACTIVSVSTTEIVVTLPGIGNFTGPIVVGGVSSTDISIVNHYYGVTSSSNQVVAVGGNTTLSGSTDGATWRTVDLSSSKYLSAIAWSGGNATLATVGEAGSVYTNTTGSASYVPRTSGTTQNLFGVAWSGSQFAAVGANGVILTSPDGITWTPRTSHTHNTLAGVAWCTAQFVAVGSSGTIDISPDGVAWTLQSSPVNDFLNGVGCSGSAIAVGVGSDGTGGEILSSPDGVTWTLHALSATDAVYGIAWSGTGFVAVGFGGTVYTSPDGSTWTTRNSGSADSLNAVTWSAFLSQFVAVGGFGTILTSPDGTTWTAREP